MVRPEIRVAGATILECMARERPPRGGACRVVPCPARRPPRNHPPLQEGTLPCEVRAILGQQLHLQRTGKQMHHPSFAGGRAPPSVTMHMSPFYLGSPTATARP